MLFYVLVFDARISLLFFFSRGARGHAVVMVNDPFSDLPVFLVVKNPYDLRSQIHFWILTPKKHTLNRRATVSIIPGRFRKKNSYLYLISAMESYSES